MRPQYRPLKGFTKEQLLTATLLLLDEHIKNIDCELYRKGGNAYCDSDYMNAQGRPAIWHNCTNCMLNQYLDRAKKGELSKYEQTHPKKEK